MAAPDFETMLRGGHPNSLGRTVEVVEMVLANEQWLPLLFDCYRSDDPVVRLRTSNALKRVTREQPAWLLPFVDRLLDEIAAIDQDSTRWTLANLFQLLATRMSPAQRRRATAVMQHNLDTCHDWIVLNRTMETLGEWARDDARLERWLQPRLERLTGDTRKSVARKAVRTMAALAGRRR